MEDPINPDNGPDLAFDARMRNHQEALKEANAQLEKAKQELGEVSPQMEAYASAYAMRKSLDVQGSWLIAAYQTIKDPNQRESLASNQETVVVAQNGGPKPSENNQQ